LNRAGRDWPGADEGKNMPDTAIASAYKRAGGNTGITKLYMVATDLLRRGGKNPIIVHDSLCEAVDRDIVLLKALLAEEFNIGDGDLRDGVLRYARKRAADMTYRAPAKAVEPKQTDGGDQIDVEARRCCVASPSTPLPGEGQYVHDAQGSPTSPGQPHARSEGHSKSDAQAGVADASRSSSENRDDGGHHVDGAQRQIAAVAREPDRVVPMARRGLAEMQAAKEAAGPSIFDTIRVRDGRNIGDVTYAGLDRLIAQDSREVALLKMIREVGIPPDPNTRVRDYVSIEQLQRMLQKAAEVSDAA
jgi:hypothetical protein